jgi:hypothetical protein
MTGPTGPDEIAPTAAPEDAPPPESSGASGPSATPEQKALPKKEPGKRTIGNVILLLLAFAVGSGYLYRHFWYLAPYWSQGLIGAGGLTALGAAVAWVWKYLKSHMGTWVDRVIGRILSARITTAAVAVLLAVEVILWLITSSICLRYADKSEKRSFAVRITENGRPFSLVPRLKIDPTPEHNVAGDYFLRPNIGRHSLEFEVITPSDTEPPDRQTFRRGTRIDLAAPFVNPDLHVLVILPGPLISRRLPDRKSAHPQTLYFVEISGTKSGQTSKPLEWRWGAIVTGGESKYLPAADLTKAETIQSLYNARFGTNVDKSFITGLLANATRVGSPRFEGDEDVKATIRPVTRGAPGIAAQYPLEHCHESTCVLFIGE